MTEAEQRRQESPLLSDRGVTTIKDGVVFPEDGGDDGQDSGSGAGASTSVPTRTVPRSELRPGASEREVTPVEPRSRTYVEGTSGAVSEEEVRAEGTPVEEDETRRLRVRDEEPSDTGSEPTGVEETGTSASGSSGGSNAEAPTDETTLTGGTSSGERTARETAGSESSAGGTEEIDRA